MLHLPVINIIIDKNHQSAELCWWPEENVYGHSKLLTVMYAIIKRYKVLPGKFVLLQNSSPDVEREREEVERQILVYWTGPSVQKHQQEKTEHKSTVKEKK